MPAMQRKRSFIRVGAHLTNALRLSIKRAGCRVLVQRLKRVSNIDIETCRARGGAVRIIAFIEESEVVEKILTHLDAKAPEPEATRWQPCRAPPQRRLLD